MTNTVFSLKSQSINFINFWSVVCPLQCGKPQRARSVYEWASSFLLAWNTQLSAGDKQPSGLFVKTKHTSKGSALQAQELGPSLLKHLCQNSSSTKQRSSSCGTAFPVTHLGTTQGTTHIQASTSGSSHACRNMWPRLYFLWLFFWDWTDGEGIVGQYFSEAEKHCIFILLFWGQSIFWTLSSAALWPSYVHLIKGGDVCLNDSEFLPEIHLPQSGNFLSKRKLNLLAILNSYVYQKKKKKAPNLWRLEQLVINLKNSAPCQPTCGSTPILIVIN